VPPLPCNASIRFFFVVVPFVALALITHDDDDACIVRRRVRARANTKPTLGDA
jgi:hypothetical protein